jgi:hypothetical protein
VKDEIFHAATAEWNGKFHPSFTEWKYFYYILHEINHHYYSVKCPLFKNN